MQNTEEGKRKPDASPTRDFGEVIKEGCDWYSLHHERGSRSGLHYESEGACSLILSRLGEICFHQVVTAFGAATVRTQVCYFIDDTFQRFPSVVSEFIWNDEV